MANNSTSLSEGPVWRALTRVSAPMSLGIFAVISVGLVDAYFLGQLGTAELAAVGFIYPVTAAITSLSIGLSAGANAALSQSIGRDDEPSKTARLALHTVVLAALVGIAAAAVFYLVNGALFELMGAKDQVAAAIAQFIPWWALSFPFAVCSMSINAAYRAHGDGTTSAVFMCAEALLNIALTPLLIFGWGWVPGFEVAGAAMATFIARATIALLSIAYARWTGILRVCESPTKGFAGSVRSVGSVGLPASFSNAINPAGMAAVTAAVATLGETAVAGFGAAGRVQQLVLVPLLALSAGIGPVVGQNWGADKPERARSALWLSWAFCLGYGTCVAAVMLVFADTLAGWIAEDREAAGYAASYLRIVSWTFFGYGVLVVANAAMNARSKAVWSMGLSLTRTFALYLPLAWVGVFVFGYAGIVAAAALSNLLIAWAATIAARRTELLATDNPLIRGPARALP